LRFKKKGTKLKAKRPKREPYNVPDQYDLDKKQADIEKLSKSLDEEGRSKPLTENQLKALIRSAIRKKWMSSNQKLAFLESSLVPDYDVNTRRLWKVQCNICKCWFKKTEVEVDHIIPTTGYTSLEDSYRFAQEILNKGGEDLQILCTEDHSIKTLSETLDISFEEAYYMKQVIAWEKSDNVSKQKAYLKIKGCSEDEVSNKEKRREAYRRLLD
jgi:replication initiation and membrane attachment protein DnaB